MLKIIKNQIISEQRYNIPKILPNNLDLIKLNYGISNNDISNALGLNKQFIDSVCKQQANFSGLSVIKFMKHFNIPFNLIYNVNKDATFIENTFKRYICIIEVDKSVKICTEEEQKVLNGQITMTAYENNIIPKNGDTYLKFILQIQNNSLEYSQQIKSDNYSSDLTKYQDFVSGLKYDNDKFNYFALCYEIAESNEVTKFINLSSNFDINLIKYLDSKPFINNKKKLIKIPKSLITIENDTYILPEKYSFLKDNNIVESDRIKIGECIEKRKNIELMIVSKSVNELTKFKYLREYKNLTIADMADKLCISEETYSAIERGYLKISAQIMWKIELEFGILLEYLLNIDEYFDKYCKD